jgi:hypothetical protein
MIKKILTGIFILGLLLFLLGVVVVKSYYATSSQEEDARVFCAYDRLFVEFHTGRNTWGTILLDDDGLPVPCNTDAKKRQESYKEKKYYGT